MYKSFWSVSLFSLLLLFFVSACSVGDQSSSGGSGEDVPDGAVEVVFWNMFGGADGRIMNEIIDEFNELHPDIHITGATQDWGEFYTRLSTAVLGDTPPDLAVSHLTRLPLLVNEGILQNMENAVENSDLDWNDFVQSSIESSTVDGETYAVPLDFHAHILTYNKSILSELNLLNEQGKPEINSYDDFVNILTQVKDQTEYLPLTFPQDGIDPVRLWWAFYNQLGGEGFLSEDLTTSQFNSEIALEAFQAVKHLYDQELIPPRIDNYSEHFLDNNAAFSIVGVWSVNNFDEQMGDDLGIMGIPRFFGEDATWADSHAFILPTSQNRTDEVTQAAMKFVTWTVENGHKWAAAGHLPTTYSVLESEELANMPHRSDYAESADYMKIIPSTGEVSFAWNPRFQELIDGVWTGNSTEEDAVARIEEMINEQIR